MTLCAEDGQAILELIQKGGLLIGHTLGIVICMLCGFIVAGFGTVWASIGVSIMLLMSVSTNIVNLLNIIGLNRILYLQFLLAKTSSTFYRKSQTFQTQKLSIAEEYCQRSAANSTSTGSETINNTLLGQREAFRNRFTAVTSGQFWALFRAEALRPSFSGVITLGILLVFLAIMIAHDRHDYGGMNTEHVSLV